jgi:hypothetical protein
MIKHRPARAESRSPALFGASVEIVARVGWPIRMVCISPGIFGGSHPIELTPAQAQGLAAALQDAAESAS